MNRQNICAVPVSRKEMKTNRIRDGMFVSGKVQSTAIQSLTSPAPIHPPDQAETSTKQASHKSVWPGKWVIMPAMIKGIVHQFGMRRVRRSYRLMAKT